MLSRLARAASTRSCRSARLRSAILFREVAHGYDGPGVAADLRETSGGFGDGDEEQHPLALAETAQAGAGLEPADHRPASVRSRQAYSACMTFHPFPRMRIWS